MARKEYKIQFAGLSVGEHEFEFKVNDKFFANLDYSEIKQGNIDIKVNLLKQSSMMVLQFDINGTVHLNCDRCMEDFNFPIQGNYKLYIKVGGSDSGDENDDIITIEANEHELDLTQYFYEYIILSLPIKRVHPDDKKGKSTCNEEMINKLKNYLVENEEKKEEDPRWNQLKDINFN